MTISTKGRYALSYLTDLAIRSVDQPVTVKESALSCDISAKYLEQIVGTLCKNRIVKGYKGHHGGYVLAVDPKECTVGQILRIMEGNLFAVPCLEDTTNPCERSVNCINVLLWKKIDSALNDVVDNITLADMIGWKKNAV